MSMTSTHSWRSRVPPLAFGPFQLVTCSRATRAALASDAAVTSGFSKTSVTLPADRSGVSMKPGRFAQASRWRIRTRTRVNSASGMTTSNDSATVPWLTATVLIYVLWSALNAWVLVVEAAGTSRGS
jgi:hypothetical protein